MPQLPPLPESWGQRAFVPSKSAATPFLSASSEPPTSLAWRSFERPLLRRCPHHSDKITFEEYLGGGIDGTVFRVHFGNADSVVLKVFHDNAHPGPKRRYWAFQRECENAALIDLISSAIQQSIQPIYLNSQLADVEDARQNLRVFSDEGRRENRFQNTPAATTIPLEILPKNRCFGWMNIKGDKIRYALSRLNSTRRSREYCSPARFREATYFAIIYTYIPPDEFDLNVAQTQLDFYYLTGFSLAGWKPDNWVGSTLVDMSDLTSPFQPDWDPQRPTSAQIFFRQHLEWVESEKAIASGTFEEWRRKKKRSLRAAAGDDSEED